MSVPRDIRDISILLKMPQIIYVSVVLSATKQKYGRGHECQRRYLYLYHYRLLLPKALPFLLTFTFHVKRKMSLFYENKTSHSIHVKGEKNILF